MRTDDGVDELQQFSGVAPVYLPDGSALPDARRYSITLVPWYEHDRPLAIGSFVELRGREALDLENQDLSLQLSDGRWLTFRVVHVSETAPHPHTFVAQQWPSEHHRFASTEWRSRRAG